MLKKIMFIVLIVSIMMFVFALIVDSSNNKNLEQPVNRIIDKYIYGERLSPADRIKEEQIHVYPDKVVIDIKNARWAEFADTNSMDPYLDKGSNAIQIIPQSSGEIMAGDIISYNSEVYNAIIIHRVVEIGEDEEGIYYITKGDNNPKPDPERIRFNQVRRILVGIIY